MSLEEAANNIRINVVIPATILTPALERDLSAEAIAARKMQVLLGRLSWPGEQADGLRRRHAGRGAVHGSKTGW